MEYNSVQQVECDTTRCLQLLTAVDRLLVTTHGRAALLEHSVAAYHSTVFEVDWKRRQHCCETVWALPGWWSLFEWQPQFPCFEGPMGHHSNLNETISNRGYHMSHLVTLSPCDIWMHCCVKHAEIILQQSATWLIVEHPDIVAQELVLVATHHHTACKRSTMPQHSVCLQSYAHSC